MTLLGHPKHQPEETAHPAEERPGTIRPPAAPPRPGKSPHGGSPGGGEGTARKGLGWLPDPPEVVAGLTSARALMGAPSRLPSSASLEPHVSYVNDQQWTSSCVGQSLQQCMNIRLSRMGAPTKKFSAAAIYANARMLGRASKNEPLEDFGCYPHLAVQGTRELGVAYEETWPLVDPYGRIIDENLNREPPLDVQQEASAFEVSGVYPIDSDGEDRVRAVMQALAAGYPVAFGTQIDDVFMNHRGADPIGRSRGHSLGGHMMLFVGYRPSIGGKEIIFRGLNSWGTSWGDTGFFNAEKDFLLDPNLTSLYAFTIGARTKGSREERFAAYKERADKLRRGEDPDAKEVTK